MSKDLAPTAAQIQAAEDRLAELETRITKGLGTFVEVGLALDEVRRDALYRLRGYDTFEDYVTNVWDRSRRWAYFLISGAETAQNVNHGSHVKASSERQMRVLAKVPEADQPAVWQAAVALAGGSQPTAAQVTLAAQPYLQGGQTDGSNNADSTVGAGGALDHHRRDAQRQPEAPDRDAGSAGAGGDHAARATGKAGSGGRETPSPIHDAFAGGKRGGEAADGRGTAATKDLSGDVRTSTPKARPPEVEDVEPVAETPRQSTTTRKAPAAKPNPHEDTIRRLVQVKTLICSILRENVDPVLSFSLGSLNIKENTKDAHAHARDAEQFTAEQVATEFCALMTRVLRGLRSSDDVRLSPPTEDEVIEYATGKGLTRRDALAYHLTRTRSGWLYDKGTTPVRDWRSDVVLYTSNVKKYAEQNGQVAVRRPDHVA